jgi:hypothetical protein
MRATKVATALAISCIAMLIVVLCFRAFVYSRLYIAPGDPYGVADLIELFLGLFLIALLLAGAGSAIWLAARGPWSNRVSAIWVALVVVGVAVTAGPLHTVVARWASS